MRALKPGGVLSVTLWNKEEPPKSVLKLYATMVAAARDVDGGTIAGRFFVASTYLSTATVLYKRGGFTAEEIDEAARAHARDVVRRDLLSRASPTTTRSDARDCSTSYREQIFGDRRRRGRSRRRTPATADPLAADRRRRRHSAASCPATDHGPLAWQP